MRRNLHLLSTYIGRYFLQWLAWRSFAVTLVVNQVIPPLIGLAVWKTAFPHDAKITAYFAALLIIRLLTVSYENHTFSGRIFSGDLSDDLLRPHPVFYQSLGENIALRIWHFLIAIPLLLCVGRMLPFEPEWHRIAAAVPAVLVAAALQYLFTFMLAMSAFWTGRAHAIVSVGGTLVFLLGGVAVPVSLMPPAVQHAAIWLPFRSMMGFPAEISAGMLDHGETVFGYGIQLAWLILMGFMTHRVWTFGIRKYTAAGA